MLLSSKNDESDGIKTFEVYSSYITLASNLFNQTKTLICVMVYIVEKSVTFWNEGTFSLTSFMQELHVIFNVVRDPCQKITECFYKSKSYLYLLS